MRRFLLMVFLFLAAGYAAMWITDIHMSERASKAEGAASQWEEWINGGIETDCLVLGSSRANQHVSPQVLDSILGTHSYNAGIAGLHFDFMRSVYDFFRTRDSKPRVVLINVDHSSLSPTDHLINRHQYLPWFHNKDFRRLFFPIIHPTFPERFLPMYRFRGYHSYSLKKENEYYRGFRPKDTPFNGKNLLRKKFPFIIDESVQASLNEMLDRIEQDGAKAVLFYSPIHVDTYRRMHYREDMLALYDSLSAARGIPILDYTNMWISRDSSFFVDGVHLNQLGATVFTDSLAHGIARLGLLN